MLLENLTDRVRIACRVQDEVIVTAQRAREFAACFRSGRHFARDA
jgi:hypothetical protein